MSFYLNLQRIEQETAKAILEQNVLNSQRVIAGDFESALSDVILQLEHPPVSQGNPLSVVETTKRIGHSLREGLIGLSPNGFEFCLWLWDVAPLHTVRLAGAPSSVEAHAAGVLQLRKIAAIVLNLYIAEQPLRLDSVIPLLDSSLDWYDARQLIVYAMLDYYLSNFEITYQSLLALAHEKKIWRAILPLEVGKEMVAENNTYTAMTMAFLNATQQLHDLDSILHPLRLFVRSMVRFGEPDAVARYLATHADGATPAQMISFSMAIIHQHAGYPAATRDAIGTVLRSWHDRSSEELKQSLDDAMQAIGCVKQELN